MPATTAPSPPADRQRPASRGPGATVTRRPPASPSMARAAPDQRAGIRIAADMMSFRRRSRGEPLFDLLDHGPGAGEQREAADRGEQQRHRLGAERPHQRAPGYPPGAAQ